MPTIDWDKPDIILKDGIWELKIYYILKGTRSEGLHGILFNNNKDKGAGTFKEKIETDLGELIYFGKWEDRKHLFSLSGWLPKNLDPIYPSWKSK